MINLDTTGMGSRKLRTDEFPRRDAKFMDDGALRGIKRGAQRAV